MLQITQGYAEQRESGRGRARRTSPGGAALRGHARTDPCIREGGEPVCEEGGPMSAIIYIVGAVVILVFALKSY